MLAHRAGSRGASADTPTGNSGSHMVSLSLTTTLPVRRDTTCSLSFPLRYKSEMAGGKEVATWPGRGDRHSDGANFSIKVFKTAHGVPGVAHGWCTESMGPFHDQEEVPTHPTLGATVSPPR